MKRFKLILVMFITIITLVLSSCSSRTLVLDELTDHIIVDCKKNNVQKYISSEDTLEIVSLINKADYEMNKKEAAPSCDYELRLYNEENQITFVLLLDCELIYFDGYSFKANNSCIDEVINYINKYGPMIQN